MAILHGKVLILLFLSCQVSELSYYQKKFVAIIFQLIRPVKEGRWLSSYSKLQDNSCFWILRRSIFRIYVVIKIHILGYIWAQKSQYFPKFISHQSLVVKSWLTPQNDGKTWFTIGVFTYVYPSDNQKTLKITIICFFSLIMKKLYDFPYLMKRWSY